MLATDQSGAVTWKAVMDAFGEAKVLPQNRITMNLRLPGQYFDAESGMHYNLHRDYNPETGRYLQSDPIGLNGGINLYGHVEQNPLSLMDTRGMAVEWNGHMVSFKAVGFKSPWLITNFIGASAGKFTLTSECKCGKQYRVEGFVVRLAGGKPSKIDVSYESLGLTHEAADCPVPYAAQGVSWTIAGNLNYSIFSVGGSVVRLGALTAMPSLPQNIPDVLNTSVRGVMEAERKWGWDFSVEIGVSYVQESLQLMDGCCER